MFKNSLRTALAAAAFAFANTASAGLLPGDVYVDPTNVGPPVGAILDLAGSPILGSYTYATVSFVAATASTNISFAFREDPAFLVLSNVSVVDSTAPAVNLLTNGDFSAGPVGSSAPDGWTYLNIYGASFGGVVTNSVLPETSGNVYADGAVQAYDAITQVVATTPGDLYTIGFYYEDTFPDGTNYSDLSTNGNVSDTGGNGRDLLVYAQEGIPAASGVPEPATLTMLGMGIASLVGYSRRRRTVAAV